VFAEAYRVLVDTRLGETHPAWPLVDPSFFPDQAALAATEQDVLSPWPGPTERTFHVRGRVWSRRLATPLDGTLTVHLARPAGITLIGDDGSAMRPDEPAWNDADVPGMRGALGGHRADYTRDGRSARRRRSGHSLSGRWFDQPSQPESRKRQ
jgi:hypothetical protein